LVKRVGQYDFLESGSAICHAGENIVIEFRGLIITLIFRQDAAKTEPAVKAEGGGQDLKLIFTNYNLGVGYVNTKMLPLGVLESRKLYMNYAIYGFGTPPVAQLVHYTILLGENA